MRTCLAPEFHLLLALLPSDQLAESADKELHEKPLTHYEAHGWPADFQSRNRTETTNPI